MAPTMIGGVPHHKIVMITGVSRGLGRALSLELASQGHTIIGCARSQDKLDTLMEELPRKFQQNHLLTNLDVRSDIGVKEMAKLVAETGRVPDIIGIEGASEEFVYGEEGLTWAQVEEASGAAEHLGPSTRSGKARPFTTQPPLSDEGGQRFR